MHSVTFQNRHIKQNKGGKDPKKRDYQGTHNTTGGTDL
jgi:hypothetical protein